MIRTRIFFLFMIFVVSVRRCSGDTISVCHDGTKTIQVPRNQLWRHRAHGDKLGQCGMYPGNRITICHYPGEKNKETLTIDHKLAYRHLINHRKDFIGRCGPDTRVEPGDNDSNEYLEHGEPEKIELFRLQSRCISVSRHDEYEEVIVEDCSDSPKWIYRDDYLLQYWTGSDNDYDRLCLEEYSYRSRVELRDCNPDEEKQMWYFVRVAFSDIRDTRMPVYRIMNAYSGNFLERDRGWRSGQRYRDDYYRRSDERDRGDSYGDYIKTNTRSELYEDYDDEMQWFSGDLNDDFFNTFQ